ncbi:MAG: bifunctional aspartate kinase/diaminopimelate decarboxylase [Gammaproteobacteria bacterium]|nr:bifunctional aspartate kinase/diaminopimelate decarboxylase [Gammaproteobacteria bacterium]
MNTTIDDNTFPARPGDAGAAQGERWLVMKFGGTSVASAERWATIRDLLKERLTAGYRPVVVHSAIENVSNLLEAALEAAVIGDYEEQLDEIVALHLTLAADVGVDGDTLLGDDLGDLRQLLAGIRLVREVSPRVRVKVMSLGELMSTRIGAAYLSAQGLDVAWIDARDHLRSIPVAHENERSRHLAASCAFDDDPDLQSRFAAIGGVVMTQGFIARNPDGESVLLGRGGSDTSAAYFAAKLGAVGLEIWTDVPGLFSANPHKVSGARLLNALSYEEAQEIASTGGSVLHPRCIRPVRRHGIPLRVRCTAHPELAGTLISRDPGSDAPGVKAISSRGGITVVSMETLGMWREVGFLSEAFRCFSEMGLSVDLVSTAETNVTVTLDTGIEPIDAAMLSRLRNSLERLCRVEIIENAEVVSLVGQKIRALLHEIGPALEVFAEHRIHLLSQAANDLNLSFVVEEGQSYRLLKKLHSSLVRPPQTDAVFGPTWSELMAESLPAAPAREPWWALKRDRLLQIAADESSAYVYDLDTVRAACARLRDLECVDRVYYAIKANSHPDVLRAVDAAGVNFECVSPGEIDHVLALFPDIDRRRILFTPNFAPRKEYEYAVEQGVWLTLDNLHPLREWGEMLSGQNIFLRLDTGQGRGHHEHVRTAGVHSKFGIPLFELDEVRELATRHNVRVVGLHAHTGSGILQAYNWQDVAAALIDVAGTFPDVRMLDLGGGLGVPEKPGQDALDMGGLDASMRELRQAYPQYEFWLEPGRYIVAEAGVLLTSVTQTKGKGDVRYVGVSTGMNSLIRPALYGAFHEISNLSRLGQAAEQVVNVVGPICETGDKLGTDRLLPACREGDVLLIANAGAYGYVMSSRYNLREPAAEVVI